MVIRVSHSSLTISSTCALCNVNESYVVQCDFLCTSMYNVQYTVHSMCLQCTAHCTVYSKVYSVQHIVLQYTVNNTVFTSPGSLGPSTAGISLLTVRGIMKMLVGHLLVFRAQHIWQFTLNWYLHKANFIVCIETVAYFCSECPLHS